MAITDKENATVNEMTKNLPIYSFFVYDLEGLYRTERQLVDSLAEMREAATNETLKTLLDEHQRETITQVNRLQKIFDLLDKGTKNSDGEAMDGILKEGEDRIAKAKKGSAIRDAMILMTAQKIENYEITAYGSLLVFSRLMGHNGVTRLLEDTLREEQNALTNLTELGERKVNGNAVNEQEL